MCGHPAPHRRVQSCRYESDQKLFHHLRLISILEAKSTRALLGSLNRLIITLFAPGSTYDSQIRRILDKGGDVCSKEAVSRGTLAQLSDDISGSVSCDTSIQLAVQEPLPECCNRSIDHIQSIRRSNVTFCLSCGAGLERQIVDLSDRRYDLANSMILVFSATFPSLPIVNASLPCSSVSSAHGP